MHTVPCPPARRDVQFTPRIFRYVVRLDRGGSPNASGGWCTLAACKPVIRRTARPGDWVIGLRRIRHDEVVYAMQVEEVIPLGDYWRDARFRSRRPEHSKTPDNIYKPVPGGRLARVPNQLHDSSHTTRDLSGANALVSRRFRYFGDASPQLPVDLVHLVHSGQGHSVESRRKADDVERLEEWLSYWSCGVHGRPIDRPGHRVATSGSGCHPVVQPHLTKIALPAGDFR